MSIGPTEWRDRALCRNRDPELYVLDGIANNQRAARAKELCFGCPVMVECAEDALRNGDTGVVRGGKSVPEAGGKVRRTLLSVKGVNDSPLYKRDCKADWSRAQCRECGFKLRPRNARAADYPETREACNTTICSSCRRAQRRQGGTTPRKASIVAPGNPMWVGRKCDTCRSPLRPSHARVTGYPGTKQASTINECQGCAKRKRKARKLSAA